MKIFTLLLFFISLILVPLESVLGVEEDRTPMVTEWSIPRDQKTLTLPLVEGYNYNFSVSWGDGTDASEVTSFDDPDRVHTYREGGRYTVVIVGTLEAWGQGEAALWPNASHLIGVKNLGNMGWKNLSRAFYKCQNLRHVAVSNGDYLSEVTDMSWMFFAAENAKPQTGNWDTSSVVDMGFMFDVAHAAEPDVRKWDTSSVQDMQSMFANTTLANPDVGRWDTSSVTNMRAMFAYAKKADPNVRRWDTSLVTDMAYMFSNTDSANPNVRNWDVSRVTDISYIFFHAAVARPDISRWAVRPDADITNMFEGSLH